MYAGCSIGFKKGFCEKQILHNRLPEEIEELLENPTSGICSFFSLRWSELHLGSNPTERSMLDKKLLKKQQDDSFAPSGDRKIKKGLIYSG